MVKKTGGKKKLIIVESPGKVKTIKKILGSEFEVKASVGHIVDLPARGLGVNIEKNFEPQYEVIKEKDKIIEDLKKTAEKAEEVFLAPDPDREGEAISWHLARSLSLDLSSPCRVTFNAITPKVVRESLNHPKPIDINKVNAQQSRRILDRLVGYELSPLLWRKVQRGLSAGRVQSVAVLLVCRREEEIAKFVPQEYWNIDATLAPRGTSDTFRARLVKIEGAAAQIKSEQDANQITNDIKRIADTEGLFISKLLRREKSKNPPPPFITSTLQQEAARRFGFSPSRTMRIAQKLYEGVDVGKEGTVGLITYMRTDSVRLEPEAIAEARDFIKETYGDEYVPPQARTFKGRATTQDAHEAIRPTDVRRHPEMLAEFLSRDEYKIYEMIWKRFVACQMASALFDSMTVEVSGGRYTFRAVGETLKFRGFQRLLEGETAGGEESRGQGTPEESRNEETRGTGSEEQQGGAFGLKDEDIQTGYLPVLEQGQVLELKQIVAERKETQPPPRYTIASLIKALEEDGIGRPSTYATIVNTIQERKYVKLVDKKFYATDLGILVTHVLEQHFPELINVEFTAKMETELDKIEEGSEEWVAVLDRFYRPFHRELEKAEKLLQKIQIDVDMNCEKCGSPLVVTFSSNGKFLSCKQYPDCKFTRNLPQDFNVFPGYYDPKTQKVLEIKERLEKHSKVEVKKIEPVVLGKCEKCGKNMVQKTGRFGVFMACEGYPACRNTRPIMKDIGVNCPREGCTGMVSIRRSKRGKIFYSCTNYPDCDFRDWSRPTGEKCPECGSYMVARKVRKTEHSVCSNKECGYAADTAGELDSPGNGELENTVESSRVE